MRAADYIIDIGPKAGVHGGEVVAAGTAEEIMAVPSPSPASTSPGQKHPRPPSGGRATTAW